MHSAPHSSHQIVGLLDVGTAKVACAILLRETGGATRVIGLGHQRARGLKASVIVDADAVEDSVRSAVSQAEQMAGAKMDEVVMSAACGRLSSTHLAVGLELAGPAVVSADMDKLFEAGRRHADQDDRSALHLEALCVRLDGHPVAGPVIGRKGARLAADVHLISADRAPLRHLIHVAERCHLRVAALAPSPLVSGLAVTTPDERAQGVIAIDCGAGTTGLALFAGGICMGAHVLQVGGNHLTYDLTRALGTPLIEAERIKKNYAIGETAHSARDDAIAYIARENTHAAAESVAAKQVTRAAITSILTSRVDALLQQILLRIQRAGVPVHLLRQVTLTGGGSLLPLLAERALAVLDRPVRLAPPRQLGGWPHALLQPAFATVVGLHYAAFNPALGQRLALAPPTADVWRRHSV